MNPEIDRARRLADELRAARDALTVSTTAHDAARFFDRLARLHALSPEVLAAAGASELVANALAERERAGPALGAVLGANVNLRGLWERGGRIADGAPDESAVEFGLDLLLYTGLLPWVPWATAARWRRDLDDALGWLSSHPAAFLDLPAVAADRFEVEAPLGDVARVLRAFGLTALAAAEGPASATPSEASLRVLDAARRRRGATIFRLFVAPERAAASGLLPEAPDRLRIASGPGWVAYLERAPNRCAAVEWRDRADPQVQCTRDGEELTGVLSPGRVNFELLPGRLDLTVDGVRVTVEVVDGRG